ncbi:MAG: phospholipase D-like domain-containing protein [Chlorobiales bacterium]|nr:phospholipase D-like domain-containing protein [Chlorobiales bacterium]
MSTTDALFHYQAIQETFINNPDVEPSTIRGIVPAEGGQLPSDYVSAIDIRDFDIHDTCCIAFSSRRYMDEKASNGYAEANRRQIVVKHGHQRPLTITQISLLAINEAEEGDQLYIAMHGLSPRVPEFSAIIEAARRGVRCQLILDGKTSVISAVRLEEIAESENLPIEISVTGRFMHQKYIIIPNKSIVVTGTANMSTDASLRHTEHRMLFRNDAKLTALFMEDFAEIKKRLDWANSA